MILSVNLYGSRLCASIILSNKQYIYDKSLDDDTRLYFAYQPENNWCLDYELNSTNSLHKFEQGNCFRFLIQLLKLSKEERESKIKALAKQCQGVIIQEGGEEIEMDSKWINNFIPNMICDVIDRLYASLDPNRCCDLKSVSLIIPKELANEQLPILKRVRDLCQPYKLLCVDEHLALILPYLYYGHIDRNDSTILLLDLEEVRFSYCIIRIYQGSVVFLCSKTIPSLSGHVLTRYLIKFASLRYKQMVSSSLIKDITDIDKLYELFDTAKMALTTNLFYSIPLTRIGGKVDVTIRRKEWDALLSLPLHIIKQYIFHDLKQLSLKSEVIDYVVSVGGNSSIPIIRSFLQTCFPYADHTCSNQQYPSTLGSCLLQSNQAFSLKQSEYCYRVLVDEDHYCLVGYSLQCLTRDIMIVPVETHNSCSGLVRILVERCHTNQLTKALNMPYEQAKDEKVWEYVFGYHYTVNFRPYPGESMFNYVANYSTPILPQLKKECVEIDVQMVEDNRVILSIQQLHKGIPLTDTQLRFICHNGIVIEDTTTSYSAIPANYIFQSNHNTSTNVLSSSSSIISSSIIHSVLTDRSTSSILSIQPSDSLPALESPLYITCQNHFLRTANLPQLINYYPELSSPSSKQDLLQISSDNAVFQVSDNPSFSLAPSNQRLNKRLFFKGPEVRISPITVCCYEGHFNNGKRQGKGREFSISHETVYQGQWINNQYNGNGTLWREDNSRIEGVFTNGLLNGKGTLFHPNDTVAFIGTFKDGKKNGNGQEYEEDGSIYNGDYLNDYRNGEGSISNNGKEIFKGYWKNGLKHGHGREIMNQSIYNGDYYNGYRHGKGIQTRFDGQVIYNGEWQYDKRHGKGTIYMKNNDVYEGEFVDNLREGIGKQYHNGKLVYEGGFAGGEYCGQGTLYNHETGLVKMEGDFKSGKLNGTGCIYDEEGKLSYKGEVSDNYPNGKGIQYLPTGEKYEGEFNNGRLHGSASVYSADNSLICKGDFIYGKLHGEGYSQDSQGLYQGSFQNGEKCGKGRLCLFCGDEYEGEFEKDYYNGYGIMRGKDGQVLYEGEWRNGVRCGYGRCYFGNGEFYCGMFHDNMMNGKGTYYYATGQPRFVGEFRNDKRNGEGTEYDIHGAILEQGFYVNGEQLI